ncbi:MAG: hypothetical protein ACRC8A_02780 [Microcoleaceae cyanobacterium]
MKVRSVFSRTVMVALVGLVFTISFFVGGVAQALPIRTPAVPAALTDTLTDAMTDVLTSSGKSFLNSVLGQYAKAAEGSFDENFKAAKQTVNELADELERAASPDLKPTEREAILRKIGDTQKSLQKIAASFTGLAENTEKFDQKLQGSVEDLLTNVKGPVQAQFKKNEDAFSQVAKAISAIANNTDNVNPDNLTNTINQLGSSIKSLNQAFGLGSKALQAISAFTS